MSIIFGKYQLRISQLNNSIDSQVNTKKLVSSRFISVFGFGPTKIRWILAHIGGSQSLRISSFYNKFAIIDREQIISRIISKNYFQFVGVELKQLHFRQRSRKKQFLAAFKKPISKKSPIKSKSKRKKLV